MAFCDGSRIHSLTWVCNLLLAIDFGKLEPILRSLPASIALYQEEASGTQDSLDRRNGIVAANHPEHYGVLDRQLFNDSKIFCRNNGMPFWQCWEPGRSWPEDQCITVYANVGA